MKISCATYGLSKKLAEEKSFYCNYNVVYYNVVMIVIWDPIKAAANFKKHHISFEEAQSVLESENQLDFQFDCF